jgi:hypothetical protein
MLVLYFDVGRYAAFGSPYTISCEGYSVILFRNLKNHEYLQNNV